MHARPQGALELGLEPAKTERKGPKRLPARAWAGPACVQSDVASEAAPAGKWVSALGRWSSAPCSPPPSSPTALQLPLPGLRLPLYQRPLQRRTRWGDVSETSSTAGLSHPSAGWLTCSWPQGHSLMHWISACFFFYFFN